jgi:hypothetical protein
MAEPLDEFAKQQTVGGIGLKNGDTHESRAR